jgi:ribose transport system permease protein
VNATATALPAPPRRLNVETIRQVAPILVLVALVIGVTLKKSDFLSVGQQQALVLSAAPLLVFATGMTVVIMCGGIDLSIAAFAGFASLLFARWVPALGIGALFAVMAVGAAVGTVQGFIHVKAQIPSFVVTLGGMALWAGLALLQGKTSVSIAAGESVLSLNGELLGVPRLTLVALALAASTGLLMWATPVGRWVRAVGNNETAAYLSGVPVVGTRIAAFGFCTMCSALAACMMAIDQTNGAPRLGETQLLPTVAAVVVGGTAITGGVGGVGRTIIGVLIVKVLSIGLSVIGIAQSWENVLYGALVILAAALTIDRSKFTVLK